MLCPRCNNPLEDQAAFCGVCGVLLNPKLGEDDSPEIPEMPTPHSHGGPIAPTVYANPQMAVHPSATMVAPESEELSVKQSGALDTPLTFPYLPSLRNDQKKVSWLLAFLLLVIIAMVVIGGTFWFLMRATPRTTSSRPAPAVVAKGQVSFLDSQDHALGTTDSLKVTVTSLPNPPDGSVYDAWMIDVANEQILSLGTLSKSDATTFTLAYPSAGLPSQGNLIGLGNKIEVTQEQGNPTVPTGKVLLTATFPPFALIHIRHLLFKFPTTPGNISLLTGLVNETRKVDALSALLQNNASNKGSVSCIAQAMINVIEGNTGAHYSPLAANCANVGIGDANIGDDFGIQRYIITAANHAALAASQPDATSTIRQFAKNVEDSTSSVNAVITSIDNYAVQFLTAAPTATQTAQVVSLSDRALHGFDQNGDGKIEPIVGEAGALTAYTSGQLMATLTLA